MNSETKKKKGIKIYLTLLLVMFCLVSTTDMYAQSGNLTKVTGKIIDEIGEAVIGASVIEKGTTRGTATDMDGNFTFDVAPNAILTISYLGYKTQEVAVGGKAMLSIVLKEDVELLEEVVVIGYGSVKKDDMTGSVSTLSTKSLAKGMATSASDLLVGKAPGVNVVSDGGAPGAGAKIRIRGGSSLSASNDPLVVIDGVPVDSEGVSGMSNPLSTVNPNDIESFSILKDASATAIYGSRASNGVIMITTKKGAVGRVKVNYSGSFTINTKTKTADVMNGDTFRNYVTGLHGVGSDPALALGQHSTNWQKEIFRTSYSTDHNVGVSGAIGKTLPYRASIGYTNDNGILKTSNLERWTGSVNMSPKFFNDHLSVQFNVKGVYNKNRFADTGAIGAATEMDPTQPVYAETAYGNGFYMPLSSKGKPLGLATANPLAILKEKYDQSTVKRSIGNLQLDYKMHFLPELRANLNVGYDVSSSKGDNIILDNSPMSYSWGEKKGGWGENKSYHQVKRNHLLDFYLSYAKKIKKHSFDVLGGYSWQHFFKYEDNVYPYSEAQAGVAGEQFYKGGDGLKTENYLISFFGRANYNFDNRYMFTFTLRDDGSSRFHKDNRWGLFPAVALAWRLTEEDFMKKQEVLSDFKLRLGYGITGQQNLNSGDYPYMPRYMYSKPGASYPWGDEHIQLIRPEAYDSDLKWEETTTYNAGIDFGFAGNRITGSLDFYHRKTKNLLNKVAISAGSNFSNELLTNVGDLKNQGLELNLIGRVIETKEWNWTLNYNVAYNKNKITKLTMNEDPNYKGVRHGGIDGGTGTNVLIHAPNHAFGSFYVYEQIYDGNGSPIEGAYVDQNKDGVIDEKDLTIYKNASPDVTMGLSSQLSYKNWDFNFAMHASLGNYAYNNTQSNRESHDKSTMYDPSGFLKNRMNSAIGTNFALPQYQSSYYVQNASFLRMDNISIGYTFDKESILRIPGTLRVYATVQNPFVITKYKGIDPEFNNEGIDKNIYPRPRSYMLGLSYSF